MTDRKTIDQISSDDLDQLYEQLAAEQADNTALRRQLLHCPHRDARARAEARLPRIEALADEHPAGIDTALILEALDEQEQP
ncbi:hypothetical protein ACIRJM_23080 [Streptomyces sp. NPDC102405]|uniref:hypothetical protein n=1 Tax=Streptomyces sp. NPDC102405 TaxID=3366170 RepID=UPI003811020E